MSSESTDNVCDIPVDGTCVPIQVLIESKDCRIPAGACFGIQEKIVDKHGHEVDGDWKIDKDGNTVLRDADCEHTDTQEYKAEHVKKVIKKEMKEQTKTDTQEETSIATETISIVEIPKKDPVVPQKKELTFEAVLPIVAGIVGGILGPMATNLFKNLFKNKVKKQQPEEEKEEEPTDCKTHQMKSSTKFMIISKRIANLESKLSTLPKPDNKNFDLYSDQYKDLSDRIESLEEELSNIKKK